MASRTRTHCPTCSMLYEPYARKCTVCGRTRDQLTDAEVAAKVASAGAPMAKPTPPLRQHPRPAPQARQAPPTRPAPPPKPMSPNTARLIAVGAVGFTLFGMIGRIAGCVSDSRTPPKPVITPIVVPATPTPQQIAQEKERQRQQLAHDKAMEAKAKSELAEAEAYSKQKAKEFQESAPAYQYDQQNPPPIFTPRSPYENRFPTWGDEGYGSSSSRRPEDGAPRNQRVSGYTRKDGTQVQSYSRRSRRSRR